MTGDDRTRLPEVARPDEKTVQKLARGEHEPPRKPRKRWTRRGPPEISSLRVNPEVWAAAIELAEHPRNIEIRSDVEVVVWNHPPPWP